MNKPYPEFPIFAAVDVSIVDGSSSDASISVAGSITFDWEQYTRGKSLLECCVMAKAVDPYECNFPLLTNICLPTAEEYATWEAEQAAASGNGD